VAGAIHGVVVLTRHCDGVGGFWRAVTGKVCDRYGRGLRRQCGLLRW